MASSNIKPYPRGQRVFAENSYTLKDVLHSTSQEAFWKPWAVIKHTISMSESLANGDYQRLLPEEDCWEPVEENSHSPSDKSNNEWKHVD